MEDRKINIFIIDDHKLFVEGLSSILAEDPEINVLGFSFSADEFIPLIGNEEIDTYLVDINLPGISGIELTRKILEKVPEAKILILSMYESYDYVEKAIQSGAQGYLLKAASHEELVMAIKSIAKGEQYFGKEILKILTNRIGGKEINKEINKPSDQPGAFLSKREKEILYLITQEYTTQQIAEKLFISERTVETHRKNILSKTGAKSVVGLIRYAVQSGIVKFTE